MTGKWFEDESEHKLREFAKISEAIHKLNTMPNAYEFAFCYGLSNYPIHEAKDLDTGEPIDYDTVVKDGGRYYIIAQKRKMVVYLQINDEPLTSMVVYHDASLLEVLELQELNRKSRVFIKDPVHSFMFIKAKKQCIEEKTYMIREPPIAPTVTLPAAPSIAPSVAPQIIKCSFPQCSPQAQVPFAVEYWPLFAFILLVIFMFFITSLVHEYSERVCAFQQAYDVLRQQLNDTKGIREPNNFL